MKYSDPHLIQATERALTWRVIDPSGCAAFLKCHKPGQERAAARELAVLSTLRDYPHVVQLPTLIDTFTSANGERVIVTTWVPGKPLGRRILLHHKIFKACPDRVNCRKPEHQAVWVRLSSNAVYKIISQLVDILVKLHAVNLEGEPLFHGDIAPWNLHWTGEHLYLVDLACDNAVHPFFELPEGEEPSPAGDVFQVGRLIEFLAPRLAKLFPELREKIPQDRPTMERVSSLIRTREHRKLPVFHVLACAAILVFGMVVGGVFNEPRVEHRIGREALQQTLIENPGHAVAVVDGRHEIEAIVNEPTWLGRERVSELMTKRPADLSMEFLASAMKEINEALGIQPVEAKVWGGCFDPPQILVDCSWLPVGTAATFTVKNNRRLEKYTGVFCSISMSSLRPTEPRISLYRDGEIVDIYLPVFRICNMPTKPYQKYFFYAGNFLNDVSITGVFDEIPTPLSYIIGGADKIIAARLTAQQLLHEIEDQTSLNFWLDEHYQGHVVFPGTMGIVPGLRIIEEEK